MDFGKFCWIAGQVLPPDRQIRAIPVPAWCSADSGKAPGWLGVLRRRIVGEAVGAYRVLEGEEA